MGRPKLVQKGKDNEDTKEERAKLSLAPVSKYLGELLEMDVIFGEDCIGPKAEEVVAALRLKEAELCFFRTIGSTSKKKRTTRSLQGKHVPNVHFTSARDYTSYSARVFLSQVSSFASRCIYQQCLWNESPSCPS
jgi:hypothetical protein